MINIRIDADFRPTLQWLEEIKKGTGDARPLWVAMIPRIREFVRDEFSGSNPSRWKALTVKYRHRKAKQGFPTWIGVRTGMMRLGAKERAIVKIEPKSMKWELDTSLTPTKSGIPYSVYFHQGTHKMPARPIFRSTAERVNLFLKRDIQDMSGNPRMSFTFRWLEKSIKPYQV